MKLIILRLGAVNKPSTISEGVVEIRIKIQPCKGINLTTWHMYAQRAPWVATIHDVTKMWAGSYLTLVPSSTRMPRQMYYGWPEQYPIIHSWSEVRYHPTPRHMKLLSLGIPYVLYKPVQFKCLFIRTQPTRASTDTGGGYHPEFLNIRSDNSPSFPSSILHFPLIALPGLQLCQPFDHLAKPHRTSIDRKSHIVSGFQPLVFYQ
jgi:hypothetical protein